MSRASELLERNAADLAGLMGVLAALGPGIDRAAELVGDCLVHGSKVLAFGNGGSAADVADFCTEFACRFVGDRDPYPAIDLTASSATVTATANDYGYAQVFARQVWAFGRAGDVVVGVSTSGRSENVRRGLEKARELGLASVALLGKCGGESAGIATVDLIVPHEITARIQEAHKLLLHTICEAVEPRLIGKRSMASGGRGTMEISS